MDLLPLPWSTGAPDPTGTPSEEQLAAIQESIEITLLAKKVTEITLEASV